MGSKASLEQLRAQFPDGRLVGTAEVPASALRFDAGACPFQWKDGEIKDGKAPVKMRARSGQPIWHWYWGNVVHDMAGFRTHKPTLAIDYCHRDDELLGYLDVFRPSHDGLDVEGALVMFAKDDRATEVVHKAQQGVPYEASIFFDPDSMVLEEVGPNAEAQVNGYTLKGPALILRQWSLRGVAICPHGYDGQTSTQLAADQTRNVPVQFVAPKEGSMKTTPATEAPKTGTKPEELGNPTPPTATTVTTPDPRAEFKATLEKFTAKFGAENGAKWAAEGLSYEAALEKHAEALGTQLTAEKTKSTDLAAKLAAVPAGAKGEETPVSFSDGTGKGTEGAQVGELKHRIGENLAKFAAGIKVPQKK